MPPPTKLLLTLTPTLLSVAAQIAVGAIAELWRACAINKHAMLPLSCRENSGMSLREKSLKICTKNLAMRLIERLELKELKNK